MVGCVYNRAANGTCSRDVSRTTAMSKMEFFVTIVDRGMLRIFTNTGKFFFINYKNKFASNMQSFKFKFESLDFKFCLTIYVKSYKQIMYLLILIP